MYKVLPIFFLKDNDIPKNSAIHIKVNKLGTNLYIPKKLILCPKPLVNKSINKNGIAINNIFLFLIINSFIFFTSFFILITFIIILYFINFVKPKI